MAAILARRQAPAGDRQDGAGCCVEALKAALERGLDRESGELALHAAAALGRPSRHSRASEGHVKQRGVRVCLVGVPLTVHVDAYACDPSTECTESRGRILVQGEQHRNLNSPSVSRLNRGLQLNCGGGA